MSDYWLRKYGRNADVDGAEDVSDVGSKVWPTVAFQTEIVGGLNDMVDSDGIWTVGIEGVNAALAEVTEVVTLNAATPVNLANSYYRINRMYTKAGSVDLNEANIVARHTGSANLAIISSAEGQTLQTQFTMPLGVTGHVLGWNASAGRVGATGIDVFASMRLQTRNADETWRTRDSAEVRNGVDMERQFRTPVVVIKPGADVRIRCVSINTDNVAISGAFELEGFRDQR